MSKKKKRNKKANKQNNINTSNPPVQNTKTEEAKPQETKPQEVAPADTSDPVIPQEAENTATPVTDTPSADESCPDEEPAETDNKTCPDEANAPVALQILLKQKLAEFADLTKKYANDIWEFINETKKISIPLIILAYTALIVAITIPLEHARVMKHIRQDATEFEQITQTEAGTFTIEQDTPVVLASGSDIVYKGFNFTDTVKGKNSDEFGSSYENNTDANTYLDVIIEYTHNNETPLAADKIAAMTAKSGNNQYVAFAALETEDGKDMFFSNAVEVSQGETIRLHYIFDVPKELSTNGKDLVVDAAFDKSVYNIKIR